MSASAILYLFGMAAIFVGERLVDDVASLRWLFDIGGVVAVVGSGVLRGVAMKNADDAGIEKGQRTALALTLVGAGSLLVYVLSIDPTAELLGFTGEAAERWTGSLRAFWPILWLCGSLPLLVVDRALHNSPVVAPPRRIQQAVEYGLAVALGLALIFPVNYLASRHSKQWNLSYFKTAQAGASTRAMVESLQNPVHVYAFFPPASEVGPEIENYFESLEGPKLTFQRVDQTANPRLAKKLQVRENGRIAISNRRYEPGSLKETSSEENEQESEGTVVKTLRLPTDLREAEEKLERLDQLVQKRLITVSKGERVLYLTTGHGEFSTDRSAPREQRLAGLKKVIEAMGFRVETLGLKEGLADGVPEDADVVAVIGPTDGFLEAEVTALRKYMEQGGSVLIALEPNYARRDRTTLSESDPLRSLFDTFGVRIGKGVLAAERSIVPIANNKTDRLNLVTDQFSSHPSTATLSDASLVLFTPTSGYLETSKISEIDRTVTVRSRSTVWVDGNGNLRFDKKAGEEKSARPIVAAATRKSTGEHPPWHGVVAADATLFSDLALGNRGNQQFIYDTFQWLVGTPELTGGVDNQEDVRIRHTKEGQAIWFYGTVLGVPLLLLAGGALRIWRRREGGDA